MKISKENRDWFKKILTGKRGISCADEQWMTHNFRGGEIFLFILKIINKMTRK